jgi:hypothetical protein
VNGNQVTATRPPTCRTPACSRTRCRRHLGTRPAPKRADEHQRAHTSERHRGSWLRRTRRPSECAGVALDDLDRGRPRDAVQYRSRANVSIEKVRGCRTFGPKRDSSRARWTPPTDLFTAEQLANVAPTGRKGRQSATS